MYSIKPKIFKAAIRPTMTYPADTRAEATRTRRLIQTTEIRILRRITGKTLLDIERERERGKRKHQKTIYGRKYNRMYIKLKKVGACVYKRKGGYKNSKSGKLLLG